MESNLQLPILSCKTISRETKHSQFINQMFQTNKTIDKTYCTLKKKSYLFKIWGLNFSQEERLSCNEMITWKNCFNIERSFCEQNKALWMQVFQSRTWSFNNLSTIFRQPNGVFHLRKCVFKLQKTFTFLIEIIPFASQVSCHLWLFCIFLFIL